MPQNQSPEPTSQQTEQYVTELAGPEDYWLSITDASRVTRRQEHTIRSWVSQGVLPVHPTRVGINKRTRQVRVSDLEKLTPIVDHHAAITSDQRKLDLFSIPEQQQQLLQEQQRLALETQTLQERFFQQLHTQEELLSQVQTTVSEHEEHLSRIQETFTHNLALLQERLEHQQQQHQDDFLTQEKTLTATIEQQSKTLQEEMTRAFTAQQTELSELREQGRHSQQALYEQKQALTYLLQEQIRILREELTQQEQRLVLSQQAVEHTLSLATQEMQGRISQVLEQLEQAKNEIKRQQQEFTTALGEIRRQGGIQLEQQKDLTQQVVILHQQQQQRDERLHTVETHIEALRKAIAPRKKTSSEQEK